MRIMVLLIAAAITVNAIADDRAIAEKTVSSLLSIQKIDLALRYASICREKSKIIFEIARHRDEHLPMEKLLQKLPTDQQSIDDAGSVYASAETKMQLSDQSYSKCELAARKLLFEDVPL